MRLLHYRWTMWDPGDVALLKERVKQVDLNAERKWGSMTIAGMLAHCTLALDVYSKNYELPDSTHWYSRVTRWHALSNIPFPRGVKLPVELPSEQGLDFHREQLELLKAIDRFAALPMDHAFTPHFMLGRLDRDEYGILAYKHTDHHLGQFGA